jgi:hypothetical protein
MPTLNLETMRNGTAGNPRNGRDTIYQSEKYHQVTRKWEETRDRT